MSVTREHRIPRLVFFLYVFLLVFEGALRKWIVPSLSTPLVLARDPLVLYLLVYGFLRGWLNQTYVRIAAAASFASILIALAKDLPLGLIYYGIHAFALYFPCVFVVPHILEKADIYRIGKFFLMLSIPMSALVLFQFSSSPTSWINTGIGGNETSTFGGVAGFFRVSGTFSFISGLIAFQGVVGLFLSLFLCDEQSRKLGKVSYFLLIPSLILYIVLIPATVSRTNVFQTLAIFLFALFFLFRRGDSVRSFSGLLFLAGIAALVYYYNKDLFDILAMRFEAASESEGDVVKGTIGGRLLGSIVQIFQVDVPLSGMGIGTATSFGIGHYGFPLVYWQDAELPRQVYESGLLLGLVYIGLRVVLSLNLLINGLLRKTGELSILLFPGVLFFLFFGQWGNSSILGFMMFWLSIVLTVQHEK